MKKIVLSLLVVGSVMLKGSCPLPEAPDKIDQFFEIATRYTSDVPKWFNKLEPAERIFIYYIYRASLVGNRIFADQCHRHSLEIRDLFKFIYEHAAQLRSQSLDFDGEQFLKEVETYLVYLFTNHSHYFMREHQHEKRTPERIGLEIITLQNLISALSVLGVSDATEKVMNLASSIFDADFESTCCIPGSIEESGGNVYEPGFTKEDFERLPVEQRTKLNAYFYLDTKKDKREPKMVAYKIGGKYGKELGVAAHWLSKAYEHARSYPHYFDEHIVKSLEHLIQYLHTGDEKTFKKHSIEWLQTKSRVDYTFGFIEVYKDPMAYRGAFEADVTIKTVNMDSLNEILPHVEAQLPFPPEYKRENLGNGASLPNASVNQIAFSSGELGPLVLTAAYCLPNDAGIRSDYGSKQIMYESGKGLGELLNMELHKMLFLLPEERMWHEQHDPDLQLGRDIWRVHCTLHETLGHGSGRACQHTFKQGEPLTVCGQTYKVGDTIPVTSENTQEFLRGYFSALEELRAEILALYTSVFNFDELAAQGLFGDWPERIGKEKFIEELIKDMCKTGIRRMFSQPEGETKVSGAHARANVTIMYYLLDHGGIELVKEPVMIDGQQYLVLGFCVHDVERVCRSILELAQIVQQIKSTADGVVCRKLIDTYGGDVRDSSLPVILKHNRKAVVGNLKASTRIYPDYHPQFDEHGNIIDVHGSWPASFVRQCIEQEKRAYSKEY